MTELDRSAHCHGIERHNGQTVGRPGTTTLMTHSVC